MSDFEIDSHTSLFPSIIIMRALSQTQQNTILSMLDSGHSGHSIASNTGVSIATISRLRAKHRSSLSKSSGGRPSKLSSSNIRHAVYLISSGKAETAVQVTKSLSNIISQPLHPNTVRKHLRKSGMKAIVKKKCPFLSAKHRRERLDFAYTHKDWTLEDWKRVVWSDETKINRLGSDGRKWVWKKSGEGLNDRQVQGTLKFGGGSLMMWGCFTWNGVGYACKIDGKMDVALYCHILGCDMQKTMEYYGLEAENIIF